jgi:hypothetical protein
MPPPSGKGRSDGDGPSFPAPPQTTHVVIAHSPRRSTPGRESAPGLQSSRGRLPPTWAGAGQGSFPAPGAGFGSGSASVSTCTAPEPGAGVGH